ncbi:MAG TPA: Ku protein [Acidimicrobiales bacterium]|nr:Ku protein [Acidimicrobiales bacterium]
MPRAIWSGAISFGLVSIPVKLYNAVSPKTVRFNQLDERTGSRVRQKLVSSADGSEVPRSDIVKGYEVSSGQYVVVTDDELEALDPRASDTIDIEEFVDLADIDPVYYDRAYWLAPAGAAKPYALLARALDDAGKVAIARFVMRQKQYLAAVRSVDGYLVLSTMSWADEINPPSQIPELEQLDAVDITERELVLAEQLISSLETEFEPEKHRDTHRERVLALIESKAAGEEAVVTPEVEAGAPVIDLMAALEASVEQRQQARGRHPSSSAATDEGEARPARRSRKATSAEKAPASKATSSKAPAKKASASKAPAKKATAKKAPAKKAARKSA